jgi:hypothetical protein
MGGAAHGRILARLRAEAGAAEARPRTARRARWQRPAFAAALAIVLLLLAVGAKAGLSWMRRTGLLGETSTSIPAADRRHLTGRARGARAPQLPPPAETQADEPPAEPAEEPAGAESAAPPVDRRPAEAPSSVRRARPQSRLAIAGGQARDPAAASSSPLAQESRLLARALDQLRTARDYPGALATLNEYDARFPSGLLRSEATLARLDALVALRRSSAALALLEGPEAIRGPRALELLVLRGELRAGAGRQHDAIADFDRVLAQSAPAALARRALYGRASSRARIGDVAGAAADFKASRGTATESRTGDRRDVDGQ